MGYGIRIKQVLRERGMTIKELSEKSGVSLNSLYSITKRDSKEIDPIILRSISVALGLSTESLKEEANQEKNTICPLSIAFGRPTKCRDDCAWFVKRDESDNGCCAITLWGQYNATP